MRNRKNALTQHTYEHQKKRFDATHGGAILFLIPYESRKEWLII